MKSNEIAALIAEHENAPRVSRLELARHRRGLDLPGLVDQLRAMGHSGVSVPDLLVWELGYQEIPLPILRDLSRILEWPQNGLSGLSDGPKIRVEDTTLRFRVGITIVCDGEHTPEERVETTAYFGSLIQAQEFGWLCSKVGELAFCPACASKKPEKR